MLTRRLLIVDEQTLFGEGVRATLRTYPQYRVIGECDTAHRALQLAEDRRPHLALVSGSLTGLTGMTLISSLAELRVPCAAVALVPVLSPEVVREARNAGAVGIVSRAVEPGELVVALNRAMVTIGNPPQTGPGAPGASPLTTREIEILDCVAQGFSNREIAEALFLTEKTVKNHMTSVFRKLEVDDRVQALLAAVRRGWVTFGNGSAYDSGTRRSA